MPIFHESSSDDEKIVTRTSRVSKKNKKHHLEEDDDEKIVTRTSRRISKKKQKYDSEEDDDGSSLGSFIVNDDEDEDNEDDDSEHEENSEGDTEYMSILDDEAEESDGSEESDDDSEDELRRESSRLARRIEYLKRKKKCSKEFLEFIDLLSAMKSEDMITLYEKLDPCVKKRINESLQIFIKEDDSYQPLLFRILLSEMPVSIKMDVYRKLNNSKRDSKMNLWIESLLKVPHSKYATFLDSDISEKEMVESARKMLDDAVFGHDDAKHKLIQYVCQLRRNHFSKGLVLGIKGPMGNGKTTMVEKGISQILNRPFALISLGGAVDSCFLNGHSFTYEGSTWGQIMDVLIKTKVMNPVIYFDELDKISHTPKGEEIINVLIHLIDPSQNTHFQDRYFGNIDFDLSKAVFIFSYNDARNINPILMDRIFEVETGGFSVTEKIKIAKQFLIPSIYADIGIPRKDMLNLSDKSLQRIIQNYTDEAGVRSLKKILYHVFREFNVQLMVSSSSLSTSISFSKLKESYLNVFHEITKERVKTTNKIGRINGLYACNNGTGGILPIETSYVPGNQILGLQVTGNIGKVMNESVFVARSVAWNLIPRERQSELYKEWKDWTPHIHIHCEEMSVEKEGPSATAAVCLCIYSLLMKLESDASVAITGEMNLSGEIKKIGGLQEKLQGAFYANVKLFLYPVENEKDMQKILLKKDYQDMANEMKMVAVASIQECLNYLFPVSNTSSSNNHSGNKKRVRV